MDRFRLLGRLSLRAQLLIPAGLALAFMLLLAVNAIHALERSAGTAARFKAEVELVQTLRDSNSLGFESDRWQHLALRATSVEDFEDSQTEALDTMDEAIEGFQAFAKSARTPELRAAAAGQVTLLKTIRAERAEALSL